MILTEKCSTERLMIDANFHLVKLRSDPETAELAPKTVEVINQLQEANREVTDKKMAAGIAREIYESAADDLIKILRDIRYAITVAVEYDRKLPSYMAIWPHGTDWINLDRGIQAIQKSETVAETLGMYFPEIAAQLKDRLNQAIQSVKETHITFRDAKIEAKVSFSTLVNTRAKLTNRMRGNRGLLWELFPRDKGRRRRFFRKGYRNGFNNQDDQDPNDGLNGDSSTSQESEVPTTGAEEDTIDTFV